MNQRQSQSLMKSVQQLLSVMRYKNVIAIALLISGWATPVWAQHPAINSSQKAKPTQATRANIVLVWEGYTDWGDGDNTGCKSLQLSADNRAMIGSCDGKLEAKEFFAGIEQEWADIQNRFAPFTYKSATDRLVFRGRGKLVGLVWQRAVVAWAHSIYGSLYSGRRSATGRNVLEWWYPNGVPGKPDKCGVLVVREIGDATASTFPCGQTGGRAEENFSGWLTTREWEVFDKWLYHRAELCIANQDASESCLNGKGKRKMNQRERAALSRWAKAVFIRLQAKMQRRWSAQTVTRIDDYAIYSAILAEYDDRDTSPHDATPIKLLVIHNSTSGPLEGVCSPDEVFQRHGQSMTPDLNEASEDYKAKNKEPQKLSRSFDLRHQYILIDQKESQSFFEGGVAKKVWDKFRAKYPNSPALITLSRVGFNPTRTVAVVYRWTYCGMTCGDASYFILAKEDGAWKIVNMLNCVRS